LSNRIIQSWVHLGLHQYCRPPIATSIHTVVWQTRRACSQTMLQQAKRKWLTCWLSCSTCLWGANTKCGRALGFSVQALRTRACCLYHHSGIQKRTKKTTKIRQSRPTLSRDRWSPEFPYQCLHLCLHLHLDEYDVSCQQSPPSTVWRVVAPDLSIQCNAMHR